MPSIFAHALAGAALATTVAPRAATRRIWIIAALCAAVPDVDAVGRPFGNLSLESVFGGHRGITHSLAFAIILGVIAASLVVRGRYSGHARLRLWFAFALATASHGVLDMLSVIGDGAALWAPFSWTHYEFLWRPIGDLGPGRGGPARLVELVGNELLWVGLPSLLLVATARLAGTRERDQPSTKPAA